MEEKAPRKESTYTKEQVIQSQKYRQYRDVFAVLLDDDTNYTRAELEKIKDDFLQKEIKEEINR